MKKVIEIVAEHLAKGGFDGLLDEFAECGCEVGDLVPCARDFANCSPAYKGQDPSGEADWRMYRTKEAASKGGAAHE